MTLSYFNIQRFCLHDGDGIRTTVFLKGCPLNCVWCHNPESKNSEKELLFNLDKCTLCGRCLDVCRARKFSDDNKMIFNRRQCSACGKCVEKCFSSANNLCGRTDTLENILKEIKKDKSFYETSGGGMTVSGGEPAIQAEEVLELIRMAKDEGISATIETCGFGDSGFFCNAAELDAVFLYDIKGIDREKHKENTGVYPDIIHKNLDMLLDMGARVIIRLPLIPPKNDSSADLALLCEFLSERKNLIEYAEIMPYHELGRDKTISLGGAYDPLPSGKPFAKEWQKTLSSSGVEIKISGK